MRETETLGQYLELEASTKGPASNELITDDFIGVEVELERANHIVAPPTWRMVSDGSLRDDGAEFVFRNPMNGSNVINSLVGFERSVVEANKARQVSLSVRTSVHVHVDVRDMTDVEIMRMIAFYSIFEKPIFRAFADNRYSVHFCIPFNHCLDMSAIIKWVKGGFDVLESNLNIPDIGRYCALNLKSIFKFGSIEFRHHGGGYEKEKLLLWINACLAFKRAARMNTDFRQTFFLNSANGFEDHLRQFFSRPVVDKVLQFYEKNGGTHGFNEDVIEGIRYCQHMMIPSMRFSI